MATSTGKQTQPPESSCQGIIARVSDHLGTPQRVTNAEGEVVWAATDTPFGEMIEADETYKLGRSR